MCSHYYPLKSTLIFTSFVSKTAVKMLYKSHAMSTPKSSNKQPIKMLVTNCSHNIFIKPTKPLYINVETQFHSRIRQGLIGFITRTELCCDVN